MNPYPPPGHFTGGAREVHSEWRRFEKETLKNFTVSSTPLGHFHGARCWNRARGLQTSETRDVGHVRRARKAHVSKNRARRRTHSLSSGQDCTESKNRHRRYKADVGEGDFPVRKFHFCL